jgi:hypothetical protein
MPALPAYETFGLDGVRGPAFDRLASSLSLRAEGSRAETRAQQAVAAANEALGDDEALVDMLAEWIATDRAAQSMNIADARLAVGRKPLAVSPLAVSPL